MLVIGSLHKITITSSDLLICRICRWVWVIGTQKLVIEVVNDFFRLCALWPCRNNSPAALAFVLHWRTPGQSGVLQDTAGARSEARAGLS